MMKQINQSRTVPLTICSINGESDCFEFDSPQEETSLKACYIQRILNSKELMLELGDRLLVIPMPIEIRQNFNYFGRKTEFMCKF
ncbi:MAG: hypothetical protein ACOVQ7_14255 [Limnoraphis robusta]|jgi:hypothetical protein